MYTFQTQTDGAARWRREVGYRTILLLRVTMDALLWSSTERDRWEGEYFRQGDGEDGRASRHFHRAKQLSHGRRSHIDENFRAPVTAAHVLRQTVMEVSAWCDSTVKLWELLQVWDCTVQGKTEGCAHANLDLTMTLDLLNASP